MTFCVARRSYEGLVVRLGDKVAVDVDDQVRPVRHKALIEPLPPAGTMAAFATILPSNEFSVETSGCVAPPGHTFLASRPHSWWQEVVPFFDVRRERIWIFWRRVLHTAHHRTQLTVYLRLLDRAVPSTYGPTADITWTGADPTTTVEAASRQ